VLLVAWLVSLPVAIAKHPSPQEVEAKQHYQSGMAHYDLGEFNAAIDEFKVAYTLTSEPGLLFNIAQAYRLAKEWPQARDFYERYLSLVPDAANRADVQAQLAKVRAELAAQEDAAKAAEAAKTAEAARTADAAKAAETAKAAPIASAPRPRFLGTKRGKATVALAALGGAAAVGAAATGALALTTRSDYDRGCSRGPCDGALYDSGRHLAIATDVLIGVAVVAGATALVLALTRPRARDLRVGWAF